MITISESIRFDAAKKLNAPLPLARAAREKIGG
jgi:hypothetical protein